jgi:hypothetical protein
MLRAKMSQSISDAAVIIEFHDNGDGELFVTNTLVISDGSNEIRIALWSVDPKALRAWADKIETTYNIEQTKLSIEHNGTSIKPKE